MPSDVCCVFPFPPQILDRCAVWPLGNSPNQVNHLGGERTTALFIYAPKIGILNIYHTFHLMSFSATNAPLSLARSWTVASFPLWFKIVCNPAHTKSSHLPLIEWNLFSFAMFSWNLVDFWVRSRAKAKSLITDVFIWIRMILVYKRNLKLYEPFIFCQIIAIHFMLYLLVSRIFEYKPPGNSTTTAEPKKRGT